MLRDEITINRVNELSEYERDVPSDDADWAGLTSYTQQTIQHEYRFEESGVAVVGDAYDHDYQFITSARINEFKEMQENVGWFNDSDERNAEGIVTETGDSREMYTLHGRIRALFHELITDGRRHGDPTVENTTVEYTKHDSLDRYVVLIKWS